MIIKIRTIINIRLRFHDKSKGVWNIFVSAVAEEKLININELQDKCRGAASSAH